MVRRMKKKATKNKQIEENLDEKEKKRVDEEALKGIELRAAYELEPDTGQDAEEQESQDL